MKSQNLRLVIGILIGAGAMLALGQKSADSQIGRYQIASEPEHTWVVDTTNGEIKLVYFNANGQYGIPFSEMKKKP